MLPKYNQNNIIMSWLSCFIAFQKELVVRIEEGKLRNEEFLKIALVDMNIALIALVDMNIALGKYKRQLKR